jgi:hypothetical protein
MTRLALLTNNEVDLEFGVCPTTTSIISKSKKIGGCQPS